MEALQGPLSFATVSAHFARADALAASGQLDLSGVTHCDSAGAALLIELQRSARRQQKTLNLVNAPAPLRELLQFFGIDRLAGLG